MKRETKEKLKVLREKLKADRLKRGKEWNGYTVYEPVYKQETIIGFPKIVLEREGEVRLSTIQECFVYRAYIKSLAG